MMLGLSKQNFSQRLLGRWIIVICVLQEGIATWKLGSLNTNGCHLEQKKKKEKQ